MLIFEFTFGEEHALSAVIGTGSSLSSIVLSVTVKSNELLQYIYKLRQEELFYLNSLCIIVGDGY